MIMAMMRDKNMNIKSKRTVIAAVRRVVFAGIILLVVWLILLSLKERFPLARLNLTTNLMPATSASLIIRQNLGATLGTFVSTITYLGFGISPGIAELGTLVNTGNAYAQQAPWLVLRPIIILSLILLIWVMTGDALLERLGFRSKAVWSKTME
jgi:hypothetical protein